MSNNTIQWTGNNPLEIAIFLNQGTESFKIDVENEIVEIKTKKGLTIIHKNDYIVKDCGGEFYAFKQDIFEKACADYNVL